MSTLSVLEQSLTNDSAAATGEAELENGSPHSYNRFFGGRNRINQPFITGYFQVLLRPPASLDLPYTGQQWFHSTAESFTPPSFTPILADVPAMGGANSSFLAGVDITRTFTLAFREYQRLPILSMINEWVSKSFNPNYGMSTLPDYSPSAYKGDCIVLVTTPQITKEGMTIDSDFVEKCFYFDGVFPEQVPFDSLNSDISSHDGLQLSVSFRFDGWPRITGSKDDFTKAAVRELTVLADANIREDYWDYEKTLGNHVIAGTSNLPF
jgi:hypothetical protein